MLFIQVLTVLFCLFAITRVLRRFRLGHIGMGEQLFWMLFWLVGVIIVLFPDITLWVARLLGVGRGTDAIFYIALVSGSYVLLRFYLKLRNMEQELTQLVRQLALQKGHAQSPPTDESRVRPIS